MKNLLLLLNIFATLFLFSCNHNSTEKTTTTPVPDPKTVDVKLSQLGSTQDFVCGMPLNEGGIADTASFENKLYGFCSPECKVEFLKNPATYLAQK